MKPAARWPSAAFFSTNGELKVRCDQHAASLTKQLLTFSRRQLIQPRATDLSTVLRESQLMVERVIGEDVRLVTTLDPEGAKVMADPDQIRRVIMNLAEGYQIRSCNTSRSEDPGGNFP
jgi:signal transduction histidine kinase